MASIILYVLFRFVLCDECSFISLSIFSATCKKLVIKLIRLSVEDKYSHINENSCHGHSFAFYSKVTQ